MGITFDETKQIFHLQTKTTSYIFQLVKSSYLAHLYWGKKVKSINIPLLNLRGRLFSPTPDPNDRSFSLDLLPQEFPAYGNSDFRHPCYQVEAENGSNIADLRYETHEVLKGKPPLQDLPATYVENDDEAETLRIVLKDQHTGLEAVLSYTVYEEFDAITRSVFFVNKGGQKLKLQRALSMSLDFHHAQFDLMHLSGSWSRERWVEKRSLTAGQQSIESRRGASSHQHNPFIALLSKDSSEDHGEVYGFNLVYSGNFKAQAEVDQFNSTRVSIGINPFDFSWLLEPGEAFQTPEAVLVYSAFGLGGMSRTYHDLYRNRLCRGQFRDQVRPTLVNNWEFTRFDFNEEKILEIAQSAKEMGIEMFVLDDGWFGHRDGANSSLGDWYVYKKKLPNGLDHLVRKVNGLGMKFGLWFEPEMISRDSDLYRKHPDWCLHVPGRSRSEGRGQLILDLSREEVCDWMVDSISNILSSAPISYVKWDMNRNMTEIGSPKAPGERQRETAHRYMLGLYRVLEKLTSSFPDVLFEGCSGGGGRFDPGMLYYMPQIWTSDDTDAVERLKIQYGTSMVYPSVTMGAHVSDIPNKQTHRMTPLETRGWAAMSGNFGYEMDLTKLSSDQIELVKQQVEQYKGIKNLVQFGDFYRLLSPFEGNETAWMYVSKDRSEAAVMYFKTLAVPNGPDTRLRLKGLDDDLFYSPVDVVNDTVSHPEEAAYGGDELMNVGLPLPSAKGDFQCRVWIIRSNL